jgi:hypothetical protein
MNEKTTPGCSQKAEASPVSCCGSAGIGTQYVGPHGTVGSPHWISGSVETAAGFIPKVSTVLCFRDRLGGWKVRWGLGRMRYTVAPGLYAVGEPDAGSPVFVSANYKLSFDRLRESLSGIDGWILVLDTRGVNVWCAAGKGTFGTEEVLRGLEDTALGRLVSHRVLILPQLSAPGVAADEVYRRSGFQIVFGPVRACDLPAFLDAGMAATPEMRRVRFDFRDRIVLAPVELVQVVRHPVFLGFLLLWVLNAAGWRFLSLDALAILGAILVGTVAVPAFLPWIPGRALSWKGWLLGLVWAVAVCVYRGLPASAAAGSAAALSYALLLPALSAFLAMNFTGSTTYTSLSGVVNEMKTAIPLMILSGIAGIGASVVSVFLQR